MYAKPSPSQNLWSVSAPFEKSPNQSPTSSIRSITPSGVTRNSSPTAANVAASARIVSTTSRSAASGDIARHRNPVATIAAVIERDQVLHVARLARLRLTDEEVERMSGELSSILDHIEKINELDLEDVAPTSHVIGVE